MSYNVGYCAHDLRVTSGRHSHSGCVYAAAAAAIAAKRRLDPGSEPDVALLPLADAAVCVINTQVGGRMSGQHHVLYYFILLSLLLLYTTLFVVL